MSGDTERTSVFIDDAVLRLLGRREDTIVDHALKNPIQLVGHGWSLEDLTLHGAWSGDFRGHEAVCAPEMHGSAAEICSPGAFGGVIKECEEACLFGERNEVLIDYQAWYGGLLRAQNSFIVFAAICCMNRRFRGAIGLGNWYEEVIDGFLFFNGWFHSLGKRFETTSRGSVIAILFFHSGLRLAWLSNVIWKKSQDAVGVKQEYLRVANIEGLSPQD